MEFLKNLFGSSGKSKDSENSTAIKVVGNIAYELLYKEAPALTDTQADALIVEYEKLGLLYKKGFWEGDVCILIKTSAVEYVCFKEKLSESWQSIHDRVGHGGCISRSNTYTNNSHFHPESDWDEVVSLIDASYGTEEYKANSRKEAIDYLATLTIDETKQYAEVEAPDRIYGKVSTGYYMRLIGRPAAYPLSFRLSYADFGPFDNSMTAIYPGESIVSRDQMDKIADLYQKEIKLLPNGEDVLESIRKKSTYLEVAYDCTYHSLSGDINMPGGLDEIVTTEVNGRDFFFRTLSNSKENPILDNTVSEIIKGLVVLDDKRSIEEIQHAIRNTVLVMTMQNGSDYEVIDGKVRVEDSGNGITEIRYDCELEALIGYEQQLGNDYAFNTLIIGYELDKLNLPFGKG